MSMSISQYGSTAMNTILNTGIKNIENEQELVTWQSSEGTLSQSIAGLGDNRQAALALSPKLSEIQSYQTNLTTVQSRLSLSSSALNQIVALAQDLNTQTLRMHSSNAGSQALTTAAADSADHGLSLLGSLLNTTDANRYVFSGTASDEPPILAPSQLTSSPLAKNISKIVSGLNSTNADDVFTATTTAAADNSVGMSVFSSALSLTSVQATQLRSTSLIGTNGASTTTGPVATEGGPASKNSTGSPIRDLIRDMMVISSMRKMDDTKPGYHALIQQLHTSLSNAANQLIDMETSIGTTQNTLTRQQGAFTSLNVMIKEQLSTAMDANLAEVATRSADLNLRLKASFMLIANTQSMTLASYM